MKLAINGGTPVRTTPFPRPPVGGREELDAVRKALKAPSLNYGIGVGVDKPEKHYFGRDFEEAFAKYHGAKYGILVSNGSIAIAMALRAAGVDYGDEVVFQPYTCYANVEPVVQVGAVPVFVDIDPETYCIDPDKVEEKISARTRAIVAIHWGGRPADLTRLRSIARKHKLVLIEDCAVAHGAEWKGRKVGTFGRLGTFSFGWGKTLSCGEAGMVFTNNRRLAERCYAIRDRGRDRKGEVCTIGWNCRVSEMLPAFLLEKLKKYPAQLKKRSRNVAYLKRMLRDVPGIELLKEDSRVTQNAYSYFIFRFDRRAFGITRARFIDAMGAEGVSLGGPNYPVPLYRSKLFTRGILDEHFQHVRGYRKRADYTRAHYPESERAYRHEAAWLPHGCLGGPKSDMDDIAAAVAKVREHVAELR